MSKKHALLQAVPLDTDFYALTLAKLIYPEATRTDTEGRTYNRAVSTVVRILDKQRGIIRVRDGQYYADADLFKPNGEEKPLPGSYAYLQEEERLILKRLYNVRERMRTMDADVRGRQPGLMDMDRVLQSIRDHLYQTYAVELSESDAHSFYLWLRDDSFPHIDELLRMASVHMEKRRLYTAMEVITFLPRPYSDYAKFLLKNHTGNFVRVFGTVHYEVSEPKSGT